MTAALDATWAAATTLRAHLAEHAPNADIRAWRLSTFGIRLSVGPELGIPIDNEIRPQLFDLACVIDPAARFLPPVRMQSTWLYQWECDWAGLRVSVKGEGKGEPVETPGPLPKIKAVAA